jgi:hypothetical protein
VLAELNLINLCMKPLTIAAFTFCSLVMTACTDKTAAPVTTRLATVYESFESVEDDMGPPPPEFRSPYKSVPEWLNKLCKGEKPAKPIDKYRFALFESPDEYVLSLTGTNTTEVSDRRSETHIEFTPKNMYYRVPAKDHKNLTRDQLLQNLTKQFDEFINSEKFRTSFFAEAKSIDTDWKGKVWSHK